MYGFIYITTNKLNGKKYLGQRKYSKGWENYLGSGVIFVQALKKYGKQNFTREIIAEAYSTDELNKLEEKFIKEYNCCESDKWYNIRAGGVQTNPFTGYNIKEKKRWKENLTKQTRQARSHPFYVIDLYTGKIIYEFNNNIEYIEKTNKKSYKINTNKNYNNLIVSCNNNHLLVYKEFYYDDINIDALKQNNYLYLYNSISNNTIIYKNIKDLSILLNVTTTTINKSIKDNKIINKIYLVRYIKDYDENEVKKIFENYNNKESYEDKEKFALNIIKKQFRINKSKNRDLVCFDYNKKEIIYFNNAKEAYDKLGNIYYDYKTMRKKISKEEICGYLFFYVKDIVRKFPQCLI